MTVIDRIRRYGANTDEAIERCCGKEDFYLEMIVLFLADKNFQLLGDRLLENDLEGAFEAAHALKGTCGNLSLDPMYKIICMIVEPLRCRDRSTDYLKIYNELIDNLEELKQLI